MRREIVWLCWNINDGLLFYGGCGFLIHAKHSVIGLMTEFQQADTVEPRGR